MVDVMETGERFRRINEGHGLVPLGTAIEKILDDPVETPDIDDPHDGREAVNGSISEWLRQIAEPSGRRSYWHEGYHLPGAIRDEFLDTIAERSEEEIRCVIRNLCVPQGSLQHDNFVLESALPEDLSDPPTEFHRRLFVSLIDPKSGITPWEGMTWILDLLPHQPQLALGAVRGYLSAGFMLLPDGRIDGLFDIQAIIRAFFIGDVASDASRLQRSRDVLSTLSDTDFELLVDHVYAELGYETRLTPGQSDGGRDVIASSIGTGRREHVLIECKNWAKKVGVKRARELFGVVCAEGATKGILVARSGFTRPAEIFATKQHRLELVSGDDLAQLLGELHGNAWLHEVDRYVVRRQRFHERESAREPGIPEATASGGLDNP